MPGDCHYLEGNANARRRIDYTRDLLEQIGINPDRLKMFNLSAAMANEFVRITREMTETIEIIGPNPLKECNRTFNGSADKELHNDHS